MLRSQSPALVAQEHAAWVISVELARATARAAAAVAVPARKGRRAGQPAQPREISFTAARRAITAATRSGAATASLPAALTRASRDRALAGWPAAASSSTATGTESGKPRPGRASRTPGRACPPAPAQPRSASADRWPPDPAVPPVNPAGPWNRPPSRAPPGYRPARQPLSLSVKRSRDHSRYSRSHRHP